MIGLDVLPSAMITRSTAIVSVLPVATGARRREASGGPSSMTSRTVWQTMVLAVADELARCPQDRQLDALLQRVMQFLDARRHLLLGAAIDDGDLGAEALGGARRVHRGVAAADDDDVLVLHDSGNGVS